MRWLFLCVLLAGCGNDDDVSESHADSAVGGDSLLSETAIDTSPPGDTGGGSDTGGGVDTAPTDAGIDTGGGCNSTTNEGTLVTAIAAGPYPTFTGGTVLDGTYVLTAWEEPGGAGRTARHTLVLAGGNAHWVRDIDTAPTDRREYTYTTAGSKFTQALTCPTTGTAPIDYTATATTITFGYNIGGIGSVFTYTKK